MLAPCEDWLTVIRPSPRFSVNADSKRFSFPVSGLESTVAGSLVNVDSTWVTVAPKLCKIWGCWKPQLPAWLAVLGLVGAAASGKSAQAKACATQMQKRQSGDWRSGASDAILPTSYYEGRVIGGQGRNGQKLDSSLGVAELRVEMLQEGRSGKKLDVRGSGLESTRKGFKDEDQQEVQG